MSVTDASQPLSWHRMDLHLHTPASIDYQQPDASPLQILQAAERQGLDIVAFTDHNSVRGYADLWREIEDLELLEFLDRLKPDEAARLAEYRRLLGRVLLLPGFEFTATFGFHVLAIFPESTSIRLMEHLLLQLGVAEDRFGSGEVGATTDVLKGYEILAEAGALVIGAHVNSTHGIAMQGLRFGGQTKIAYTQDRNLHALEVTDLMLSGGRRSTARFFNGSKAEYPRRMHSIQGSDAHRLERDLQRETNLGVGDRVTEVELPEVSFQALKDLFLSEDWERVRGFVGLSEAVQSFREDRAGGNTSDQAFHESLSTKKTGVSHILRDVVAFANGDGGTTYVGASAFEKRPVAGVGDVEAAMTELRAELAAHTAPVPDVEMDTVDADGKAVLVLRVAAGTERPYALNGGNIYVRDAAGESVAASRDQIVEMVRASAQQSMAALTAAPDDELPARMAASAPQGRDDLSRDTRGRDGRGRDERRRRNDERGGQDTERRGTPRAEDRDRYGADARDARSSERTGSRPVERNEQSGNRNADRLAPRGGYDSAARDEDRRPGRDATDRARGRASEHRPRDDRSPYEELEREDDRPQPRSRLDDRDRYASHRDNGRSDRGPYAATEDEPYDTDANDGYPPATYENGRAARAQSNRATYDDVNERNRYDREPGPPFARVPVGIAPDGGPERRLDAPPDPVAPTSGVEIMAVVDIDGLPFYTVHDLRHDEYIRNVTADTGKRLWRYAIEQYDELEANLAGTRWDGEYGFVKSYRPRGGERRYNVAWRDDSGVRIFYGVSEDDLSDPWRAMLPARAR